jgi:hypothetical protein
MRFLLAAIVIALQIAATNNGWMNTINVTEGVYVAQTTWMWIVCALLFAAGGYGLFVHLRWTWADPLWRLSPRPDVFPFHTLLIDFFNLSFLVALTGGAGSIFLPLLVVALLMGDIAMETRVDKGEQTWRWMVLAFALISVIGVVVSSLAPSRCFLLGIAGTNCPSSTWSLPVWLNALSGTMVFLGGAVFGSFVLGNYIRRPTSGQSQQTHE